MRSLALILCLFAQDDAKIEELVQKLGADDFAARESAQQELVKVGEAALPRLRAALTNPDAEVARRAKAAIEDIERGALVRKAIGEGKKISVRLKDVPLAEAAKVIEDASGFNVGYTDAAKDKRVSIDFDQAELLRVLDAVAKQVGSAWRSDGRGVNFTTEPYVDYPAAYAGCFKFKLIRVKTTTSNEFSKRSSDVELTVAVESEPGVESVEPAIRALRAADEAGRALAWEEEPEGGGGPNRSVSTMSVNGRTIRIVSDGVDFKVIMDDPAGPHGKTLKLREIPGALSKLGTLRCEASFLIASEAKKEIVFEKPKDGDRMTLGAAEIVIEEVGEKSMALLVRVKDGGKVGKEVVSQGSVVLVSGGKEYEAEVGGDEDEDDAVRDPRRFARLVQRRAMGGEDGYRFTVAIPKSAREQGVDKLKLSAAEIVAYRIEFEFKDVDVR